MKSKTSKPARSIRPRKPRSLPIAERGIRIDRDFANFMSALMSDLIDGRIAPQIGNAACNAGGKLLKVVEMRHKFGTRRKGETILDLASPQKLVGE